MNAALLREQLHQQVDQLPDELLPEIAEFVRFKLVRRTRTASYTDWTEDEWQNFVVGHFLCETEDDLEYSLEDAEVVYRP